MMALTMELSSIKQFFHGAVIVISCVFWPFETFLFSNLLPVAEPRGKAVYDLIHFTIVNPVFATPSNIIMDRPLTHW